MMSKEELLNMVATEALTSGTPAYLGSAACPWPAKDIVAKLVEAADILLDRHDYDGHGWEALHEARAQAREWLSPSGPIVVYDQSSREWIVQSPPTPPPSTDGGR